VPVLCNSLSFEQGSAQTDHIDALFMTPRTPHHLVAIWVALEDCHADAGPLKYFAGSHRIEPWVFSTGSHHFVPDEMPAWRAYMDAEVARRGLTPETFAAQRGDVFIWSAYLLHGGSPIRDPARTRKSVVFHYYSQEDCIAQRCTIVPYQGGFWMHRPHQAVPGLGESQAPPLPPDAWLPPQD
jgi:phytanoyl-CoA hydroxylase